MPGGRLTEDDRRGIAAGLADGRGFAEIARRLGRPTSTVSREVARNGGPTAYRAEHAQLATAHRARRTPSAPPEPYDPDAPGPSSGPWGSDDPDAPRPSSASPGSDGRDPEVVRGFVDRFAVMLEGTGMPRMAARVLTCLMTTDSGALTSAGLVRRLRVSPASVSKAVGFLEGLELLRRETDRRRERYVIDDDVWLRAWMTDARKHATLAETARDGAAILGPGTPAAARMEQMRAFFAQISDEMTGGVPDLATATDALTVLAALVHAAAPRTPAALAAALSWPEPRVRTALETAETHPDITDPVAPYHSHGTYTAVPRPDRLTPAQRTALANPDEAAQ